MNNVTIRKVDNGYVLSYDDYEDFREEICKNLAQALKKVKAVFKEYPVGKVPENKGDEVPF